MRCVYVCACRRGERERPRRDQEREREREREKELGRSLLVARGSRYQGVLEARRLLVVEQSCQGKKIKIKNDDEVSKSTG